MFRLARPPRNAVKTLFCECFHGDGPAERGDWLSISHASTARSRDQQRPGICMIPGIHHPRADGRFAVTLGRSSVTSSVRRPGAHRLMGDELPCELTSFLITRRAPRLDAVKHSCRVRFRCLTAVGASAGGDGDSKISRLRRLNIPSLSRKSLTRTRRGRNEVCLRFGKTGCCFRSPDYQNEGRLRFRWRHASRSCTTRP